MSLIDTLAPLILVTGFVLILIIFIGAWAIRFGSEARAKMLAQKRDLRLEHQAYQFISKLYVETNSITSDVTLSIELSDELFALVDQIDQKKELTR